MLLLMLMRVLMLLVAAMRTHMRSTVWHTVLATMRWDGHLPIRQVRILIHIATGSGSRHEPTRTMTPSILP